MLVIRMLKLWQKQKCSVDENNAICQHMMLDTSGFLPVIITETSVTFCIYVNLIITVYSTLYTIGVARIFAVGVGVALYRYLRW